MLRGSFDLICKTALLRSAGEGRFLVRGMTVFVRGKNITQSWYTFRFSESILSESILSALNIKVNSGNTLVLYSIIPSTSSRFLSAIFGEF